MERALVKPAQRERRSRLLSAFPSLVSGEMSFLLARKHCKFLHQNGETFIHAGPCRNGTRTNPLKPRNGAIAQRWLWKSSHWLQEKTSLSLCKFFHSVSSKSAQEVRTQGAVLSNLHMQVQGKSQHLWNRSFSDANKLALDWFYQLWGSMHSTPHPEVRMAQKAVNRLVLSCKCVVLAQTVA